MIAVTPDITGVAAIRHGVLRLTFADGLSGEIEGLDRMRELNAHQMRLMLERVSTEDLALIDRAIRILADAADGLVASAARPTHPTAAPAAHEELS